MSDDKTRPNPCKPDRERSCAEPFTWNDGVPYCDKCGLYRSSIHHPPER